MTGRKEKDGSSIRKLEGYHSFPLKSTRIVHLVRKLQQVQINLPPNE